MNLKKNNYSKLLSDTSKIWLIDLDNTLYDDNQLMMTEMDKRIDQYFMHKCQCTWEDAIIIRSNLFTKYENTFIGALNEKIILQEELDGFLLYAHNIKIPKIIKPHQPIVKLLHKIKGKKYIFSNSIRPYIYRMISHLELSKLFDGCLSLEDFSYSFKPQVQPFQVIKQRLNVDFNDLVLIDDSTNNIKTAERLGITSINSKDV